MWAQFTGTWYAFLFRKESDFLEVVNEKMRDLAPNQEMTICVTLFRLLISSYGLQLLKMSHVRFMGLSESGTRSLKPPTPVLINYKTIFDYKIDFRGH